MNPSVNSLCDLTDLTAFHTTDNSDFKSEYYGLQDYHRTFDGTKRMDYAWRLIGELESIISEGIDTFLSPYEKKGERPPKEDQEKVVLQLLDELPAIIKRIPCEFF